jgi:hypothetical protein
MKYKLKINYTSLDNNLYTKNHIYEKNDIGEREYFIKSNPDIFEPIKDEVEPGIICIQNLDESLRQVDVLVVSKKLKHLSKNMEILKRLQDGNLWILDPSRILLNLSSSFVDSPKYLTVGKGI